MTLIIWLAIIAAIVIAFILLQRYTKLEFVAHAKLLFKAWSVWLGTIGATLMAAPDYLLSAWSGLPDELKSLIPSTWLTYIGPTLVFLGVVSQFIRQRKLLQEKQQMERRL